MKYFDCPLFDVACPYCLASGECTLETAKVDCDAWCFAEDDDEEMEDDD